MKLILTDKADKQHDLDDIILEFAGLHASAGMTFSTIFSRLEVIEAQLGIVPELAELEPTDTIEE